MAIIAFLCFSMQLSVELNENEVRAILSLSPPKFPSPPNKLSNAYGDNPTAILLGEKLFFHKGIAGQGTKLSCSSCHDPNLGWADNKQYAIGEGPGLFNTPTIRNTGFQNFYFWDGRADSLWAQAAHPIESEIELNGSRYGMLKTIANDKEMYRLWKKLWGDLPNVVSSNSKPLHAAPKGQYKKEWEKFSVEEQKEINEAFVKALKAIAAFERTIVSSSSNFDIFVTGLREKNEQKISKLSPQAQRGMKLFIGEANCISCHFGPLLSDGQFHNLGFKPLNGQEPLMGRPDGIEALRIDPFNGRGIFSDDSSWQANAQLLYMVSNEHTVGALKTPSLRDVSTTPPYMHDGRFQTLEEVINFYDKLPEEPLLGHREETLKPLRLSATERAELIAFLKSLTSVQITTNKNHSEKK